MKPDAWRELSPWRIRSGKLGSGDEIRNNGAFMVPHNGQTLAVIVSDEEGWDHVSVSLPTRCPSWGEMSWVKRLLFEPHEVVMQLHPADSEHINCHQYCLHLWRPHDKRIPMPPAYMVGPKP